MRRSPSAAPTSRQRTADAALGKKLQEPLARVEHAAFDGIPGNAENLGSLVHS